MYKELRVSERGFLGGGRGNLEGLLIFQIDCVKSPTIISARNYIF